MHVEDARILRGSDLVAATGMGTSSITFNMPARVLQPGEKLCGVIAFGLWDSGYIEGTSIKPGTYTVEADILVEVIAEDGYKASFQGTVRARYTKR
ncbi:hypothetical protein [Pyrodictium abyssi]|uniref:Uncharacterized protein n=1 Tax=Pyrodictium abyssi TaxID=54256 RepID=A0ABM8IW25_9CREN|nr:hypothetical protein PABY_06030 [Pyrodictium abyssi]